MRRCCGFVLCVIAAAGWMAASETPERIFSQAMALQRAGDLDGAIREYREFLKLEPRQGLVHSNLGAVLAKAGRYEEAVSEYRDALKFSPGNPAVSLNLALAYYKMGRFTQAAEQLAAVHRADPSNAQATELLADCYLQLGKNKQVVELLEPVAAKNPDSLDVAYLLGTALIRDNRVEEGQVLVDRILRNGDSAEARLLMGMTKMTALDFAGARGDLEKAAVLNPKLPDVYSYYGFALMSTGDTPAAAVAYRKELETNPNDFNANLYMGVLEKQDENFDEALKHFQRALELRPGDIGVRYQIATVDAATGKTERARVELESMLKEAPQFTEAHVTLATIYYRLKRKEDGDRERALVQKLNAAAQTKQPGVKTVGVEK